MSHPKIWIGIFSALLLFIYFGLGTKSPDIKLAEKSRAQNFEKSHISNILKDAQTRLTEDQANLFETYRHELSKADSTGKEQILKELSSFWFAKEEYALAGYYAQQVADMIGDAQSWSITGTTFAIGMKRYEDARLKEYCFDEAINSFNNAISLEPDTVRHQLNLALCYTEMPPKDNPMKGVQILLQLKEKYPESASVFRALGRLAIQTGQYQRAEERLKRALELKSDDSSSACLLIEALEAQGKSTQAQKYQNICKKNQ